ncbi:MAG: hypothetical protein DRJ47_04815 [Thermoprotei archaeon]|nr:MAG: hypothetical protein DRJ47_04815 [Thermoprotei archaeon]
MGSEARATIFTWRVLLSLFLALFVLEPMLIWGNLTFGLAFGFVQWGAQAFYGVVSSTIIIIILAEVSRYSERPLSKQELFAITIVDRVLGLAVLFQSIPWVYYFVKSPSRISFGIKPPEWWAPSSAIMLVDNGVRTLIHPAWMPVLSVILFVVIVSMIMEMSLGYLFFRVRVIEEKLEFPVQSAFVAALTTLGEAADPAFKKQYRIFIFSLLTGLILGIFNSLGLLSVSMYDLNYVIENMFPGASLAIYPLGFFQGLIIPWYVTVTMAIGALSLYFFGNHILVIKGIWRHVPPSPGLILRGWTRGMQTADAIYYSTLNFWVSVIFGFAMALGILPVLLSPKALARAFKLKGESKITSGWSLFTLFASCAILSAIVISLLTGYPLPPLIFLTLIMSFILSYVWTGLLGITGYTPVNIPYLKEAVLVLGAGGNAPISIWFASPLMFTDLIPVSNASGWTGTFLQCYQLGVKFRDYITLYVIATMAAIVVGIVMYSIYWSFAPIPSALYPGLTAWENEVINRATWIKIYSSYNIFKWNLVVAGFIAGAALFLGGFFLKIPWLAPSILAGMTVNNIAYAGLIPQAIGSIIRYIILPRIYGAKGEELTNAAYLFYSGVMMGFSIWAVVFVALQFVPKALWVLPY